MSTQGVALLLQFSDSKGGTLRLFEEKKLCYLGTLLEEI